MKKVSISLKIGIGVMVVVLVGIGVLFVKIWNGQGGEISWFGGSEEIGGGDSETGGNSGTEESSGTEETSESRGQDGVTDADVDAVFASESEEMSEEETWESLKAAGWSEKE